MGPEELNERINRACGVPYGHHQQRNCGGALLHQNFRLLSIFDERRNKEAARERCGNTDVGSLLLFSRELLQD